MSISADDRTAILDLISEYAYTFDEDRIREMVDLLVDDGEWCFKRFGSGQQTRWVWPDILRQTRYSNVYQQTEYLAVQRRMVQVRECLAVRDLPFRGEF